jgi:class 3 adenylate cyclase
MVYPGEKEKILDLTGKPYSGQDAWACGAPEETTMGWNSDRSLERAEAAWDATEGLTVTDLVRETDFDSTALKNPRRIRAAHVYVDVPGFRHILGDDEPDPEVARQLHLWGREVTRIVKEDFYGTKVHFQGPRLHAAIYRPIGNDEEIATRAVLMAAAIRRAAGALNEVLSLKGEGAWDTSVGIDLGDALLTKDGAKGDRELLFLGNPANHAAKIISSGLRLTDDVVDVLPDDISIYVAEAADGENHLFTSSLASLEALCDSHGYGWSREGTVTRLEDGAKATPKGAVKVVESSGSIDKSRLGIGETKRTFGVSLFADVDGFTDYIERAEESDELDQAVRVFHVIRSELRNTAVSDYDTLRIQYQGDRMQGLVHLPSGKDKQVARKAVWVAAALNSVVSYTLPKVVGEDGALPLAIGLAGGTVLVTKLGEHGNRDVVSLGASTAEAARIQQALEGGDIGIDAGVRELLPDWLQQVFVWRQAPRAYVASDLTLDQVELLEASESDERAKMVTGAPVMVSNRPSRDETPLKPYLR